MTRLLPLWAATCLVLVLVCPLNGAAQVGDAARLQQRYDALFQQMLARPQDLDTMFEFAQVAGRLGNFESAISTLERMLILNPNLPRVRLELGVLYFRLGSYEIARTYLSEALASENLPATVERRIHTYLNEAQRELSPHKVSGTVFFGLRFQSNANAAPSSSIVRARGRDAVLDDTFTEQDDVDAFLAGSVKHSYDFQNQRRDSWESELLAYASRQFDLSDLNLTVLELRTGPRFSLVSDAFDVIARIHPYALANVVRLDDRQLFRTLGGGIRLTKPISDKLVTEGWYEFRHEDFSNSTVRPNARDFTGQEHELGLSAELSLSAKTRVGGRAAFIDDNARARFNDNWELSMATWLVHDYEAPLAVSSWPWTVSLAAERSFKRHAAPDPSIDPLTRRSDREWRLSFSNTVRFSKNWALETQLLYTEVDSKLPNFELKNTAITFGLSARF